MVMDRLKKVGFELQKWRNTDGFRQIDEKLMAFVACVYRYIVVIIYAFILP